MSCFPARSRLFALSMSALSLWLLASPLGAITVYKYRDANGVVSFTDQPTRGAEVLFYADSFVESLDDAVKVERQREEGREHLLVRNTLAAPVEVEVRLEGVRGVPRVLRAVVPAHGAVRLASLTVDGPQPLDYRHRLRYALSDPSLPVDDYLYSAPWQGGPYRITQGAGGSYSHQGERARYAVDVAMPEGTRVVAARAGVVVSLDDRQTGRATRAGNFVRILHSDGTMGVYLHLRHRSLRVQPGDRVERGQWLADSGNTGNSTGPHLHFVVQRNAGMKLVSIPFLFRGRTGEPVVPTPGEFIGPTAVAVGGD